MNILLRADGEVASTEEYKGIISLYDCASKTIMGNDYSVITTICEEYSDTLEFSLVRFKKISPIRYEESYQNALNYADIIRYDESIPEEMIMYDEDFGGRVVVDYWYDVYVVLINDELNEDFDENNIGSMTFGASIDEFAKGEIGQYLGSLKDVNTLIRKEAKGEDVCSYSIYLYPDEEGSVPYVKEVCSYAALRCDEEKKREAIIDFMEYLKSYEAVRYTENLGMLPFVEYEQMVYEKYPHLAPLTPQSTSTPLSQLR